MAEYQQLPAQPGSLEGGVRRESDGAYIPPDPANRDYQEYLTWLDQGNTPDPPQAANESTDVSRQD